MNEIHCNTTMTRWLAIHSIQHGDTDHIQFYLIPFRVKIIINDLSLLLFPYAKTIKFVTSKLQEVRYTCKSYHADKITMYSRE